MKQMQQNRSRTDNNTPDLALSSADQAALRDLRVLEGYAEARMLARSLGRAR